MSATHPAEQPLDELLDHLDDEHAWDEYDPLEESIPCDYCGERDAEEYVTYRNTYPGAGPAVPVQVGTFMACVSCATRSGRRAV